jgi:hypothetical protein
MCPSFDIIWLYENLTISSMKYSIDSCSFTRIDESATTNIFLHTSASNSIVQP